MTAVVKSGPLGGLAVPRARSFEIAVVEGAVLRTEPGRAPRTVATADETMSILHVEHEQLPKRWRVPSESPYVLFVVGDQVRLAVPYLDVAPRFADSHRESRDVSTLTAVSRELGIPIEPMPSSRVESLAAATPRSAIVRFDRRWSSPGTLALTVPVIAAFLAVLFVLPQLDLVAHIDVLTRAVGVLVLPVAAWVLWLRLRSLWLVTRSPRPSGRTVVAASFGPSAPLALRRAELQVGDDAVMFRSGGREVWVAGPRRGGISSAVVGNEAIHLLDGDGVIRLVLTTQGWRDGDGSTTGLEQALSRHAISVETTPVPLDTQHASDDLAWASGSPWISAADQGAVFPGFTVLLIFTGITGASGLTEWIAEAGDAASFIAAVVSVMLIAGLALSASAAFAWSRMQPRAGRS